MELDLRTKRAVIKLRRKGLTYEEIADALSIGRATVNRTLRAWRERRSLKGKKRGGGNPSRCERWSVLLGFTLKKRSSWPRSEAAPTFSGVAR